MTENFDSFSPDYTVHPGEYLEEVLESRGIKKREFAERAGISSKHLSEIINKKKLVTADIALKFEKILGISAHIWMNLSTDYQLFIARGAAESLSQEQCTWLMQFPLLALKKLGFLPNVKDKRILLDSLLSFFCVPSPDMWDSYFGKIANVAYRKSDKFQDNNYHIAAWLRACELNAEKISTNDYSKSEFLKSLQEIRVLTTKRPEEFETAMVESCRKAGVALVFIPEFQKTHISGVTEWLTSNKAMIGMSLRYRSNDHFWFTFFHEAAHIVLHGKKEIFIDNQAASQTQKEEEANRFARNELVPENEYKNFVKDNNFYAEKIVAFANNIGIHPGIVVGRLQYDKNISHKWHNHLKERFEISMS
jgi:addiction module HigA family antidote